MTSLSDLTDSKWGILVCALLYRRKGEKFVSLWRGLGASAGAMRRCLDVLIDAGLVMKNPGYGHPMRPEYILTEQGEAVGRECVSLVRILEDVSADELCREKWSLPLLLAASKGKHRFSLIKGQCLGITDRAASLGLKSLIGSEMLERTVGDGFPPTVEYRVTDRGNQVVRRIEALDLALS
jgi:DNA-binding HxlR family transcriptional regulator